MARPAAGWWLAAAVGNQTASPSPGGAPPHHHHAGTWVVGVALSLAGTLLNQGGMLHMKLSLMNNSLRHDPVSVLRQLRWLLGFVFYIGGQIVAMVALGFGPQSMMAALGAFSLVVNTVLSPCILGETLTCFHVGATAVIIGGVCLIVLYSKKSSQHYTIDDLEARFASTPFEITAGCLLGVLALMFLAHGPCSPTRLCGGTRSGGGGGGDGADDTERQQAAAGFHARGRGVRATLSEAAARVAKKTLPPPPPPKNMPPIYCAFVASVCSASTNLFAKCTMAVLLAHDGSTWVSSLQVWFIFGGLIITAVGTVVFLNMGLNSDADALFIVPVFFVMVLLSTTLVAAVFFGDFDGMSAFHLAMLALGALLTLAGVYGLASYEVTNDPLNDMDDSDDAEEEEGEKEEDGGAALESGDDTVVTANRRTPLLADRRTSTSARRRSVKIAVRRASTSRRFSLNASAYGESFTVMAAPRSRLSSVAEEGGGMGTQAQAAPRNRQDTGGASIVSPRNRTRTRTYTATLVGGLGVV